MLVYKTVREVCVHYPLRCRQKISAPINCIVLSFFSLSSQQVLFSQKGLLYGFEIFGAWFFNLYRTTEIEMCNHTTYFWKPCETLKYDVLWLGFSFKKTMLLILFLLRKKYPNINLHIEKKRAELLRHCMFLNEQSSKKCSLIIEYGN